jgi:hypothetical protein
MVFFVLFFETFALWYIGSSFKLYLIEKKEKIMSEMIARMQRIHYRAFNRKFTDFSNRPNAGKVVDINSLDLQFMQLSSWVIRRTRMVGKVEVFTAYEGMPLYLGDIIYNGTDVLTTIEFSIGGVVTVRDEIIATIDAERCITVREDLSNNNNKAVQVIKRIISICQAILAIPVDRESGMKVEGGLGMKG